MNFKLPRILQPVWRVAEDFNRHRSPQMAAAIAFYTIFALGPVLLIAVSIAGLVVGREEVRADLLVKAGKFLSPSAVSQLETVLERATLPGGGVVATLIGAVTLVIAATGAFNQLKEALNTIWEVERPGGRVVWRVVKARLVSFSMVLSIGALLMMSMIIGALVSIGLHWAKDYLPVPAVVLSTSDAILSFLLVSSLFALMYKVLPDVSIEWRDVWFGAAVTSVLFALGREGISAYLARTSASSVYGAAGSLVVLLLWIYYSSMIFLFGAEITHKWALWRRDRAKARRARQPAPLTETTPAAP